MMRNIVPALAACLLLPLSAPAQEAPIWDEWSKTPAYPQAATIGDTVFGYDALGLGYEWAPGSQGVALELGLDPYALGVGGQYRFYLQGRGPRGWFVGPQAGAGFFGFGCNWAGCGSGLGLWVGGIGGYKVIYQHFTGSLWLALSYGFGSFVAFGYGSYLNYGIEPGLSLGYAW